MELSAEISTALAKAQAEFQPIKRERTVSVRTTAGATYTFSYAPLETILRATGPALAKCGLALTQAVEDGHVVTRLLCGAAHLQNRIPILVRNEGPQAYGSALTYARRYGITLLLGVCADDDDDANLAEGNTATPKPSASEPRISEQQVERLETLLLEVGADRHRFLAYMQIGALSQLRATDFQRAIEALERKRVQ